MYLTTSTSTEEAARGARVAVLPIGSFEQHGDHLPLSTDSLIASAIAREVATAYNLMLLPPLAFGCSQEHVGWPGTVSIRATTLLAVVADIADSLASSGVPNLVIVNGHGGNYALANAVQEANVASPRMALFPGRSDWERARREAGLESSGHEDMHGGELETSVLLHLHPNVVGSGYRQADHVAERPLLLTLGMRAYTQSGIIGRPSLATAKKGGAVLSSLTAAFSDTLEALQPTASDFEGGPIGAG